ncbi:FMN-linked oxidoreductase [Panus rudis PR-1116 ss-1]|nr:FMN-linked oxidoreductase [Panus rudis PR-1116 ss-1]
MAARPGGVDDVPALETDVQLAMWKKCERYAVFCRSSTLYMRKDRSSSLGCGHSDVQPSLVEVHGPNGYLIDQFLQDVSNHRTDEYGGSIENRARFALDVIEAVVKAKQVGIRLSPWGMRMNDPKPTFSYLVEQIRQRWPDSTLSNLALTATTIEMRKRERYASSSLDLPGSAELIVKWSNDFLRKVWKPKAFVSAGGHNRETALEFAEEKDDLVAFGRYFISNPDLPLRLKENIPLTPYDRKPFYVPESPKGYIDYPFADGTTGIGGQVKL